MAVNTNINIPQSPFLDPLTGRPAREWLIWLQNPSVINFNIANALPISSGGTGISTAPSNGQLLIGNNNQYSLGYISGDSSIAVADNAGSIGLSLNNTGVNAGTYGSGSFVPQFSVNSKGQITSAVNLPFTGTTYTAPFTGSVTRTSTSKWSDTVSVKDFGAVGNGTTDDTAAILAAIATGRCVYFPAGNYLITNALTLSTTGQKLFGDTKEQSFLTINTSFNMSAAGVIIFTAGTPGLEIGDLGMKFVQPDTNNRASLTSYPVAIYCQNVAGFVIQNMKIVNASNGIDMRGNCGNSYIELLQMSAYGTGIWIDGSQDTVRINKFHFYNFDMTSNQASIFYTSPTRAFSVGRVDGLFIQQFLNISNLGLAMYQGSSGPPWIYVTDSGFDTWNGIDQEAGSLQVVNSYITNANGGGYYGIQANAGNQFTQFTNCLFFAGPANGTPMITFGGSTSTLTLTNCYFNNYINGGPIIYMNSSASNSTFSMSDCSFNFGSANGLCVWSEGAQQQKVHLVNNYINTQPNTSYSGPMFQFQGGCRVYMTGNRANDKGSNAATFIQNNADNFSWISGNIAPGWTNNFVGSGTGYYANNLT
ncbi:tail spike protein [Caudoviricetes sp.]|nr:tail spike protein [Caudoviricetes sp.]